MQVAIAKQPLNNAPHCGDECAYWQTGDKIFLCVVDGLGHGPAAQKAARTAVDYIAHHLFEGLPDLFSGCNVALLHTRGVAMGLAIIEQKIRYLTYAGVGNPRAIILRARQNDPAGRQMLHLPNNYGIVGAGYKTLSTESVTLNRGDLVILATDGVAGMMDLPGYDAAILSDVRWLSEKILRDWRNLKDDAAVLVFKVEGA